MCILHILSHMPTLTAASTAPSSPLAPLWRSAGVLVLLLLGVGSAWLAGRASGLQAGSDAGYWIGVAGGLAMLALFLYPLRKRLRWMRGWGSTRAWFITHMVLGLSGPWLVLVHCGFRIGSLNATVALASMTVVALSGVVGRYLYVQVHRGLSQQRTDLAELNRALEQGSVGLSSRMADAPAARERLLAFEREVLADTRRSTGASPWPMLRLWWRSRGVLRDVRHEIDRALRDSEAPQRRQRRQALLGLARAQVGQVLRVAHFASWERLFSLWHVLHLPFVHVMVVCALVHVVAVHAY